MMSDPLLNSLAIITRLLEDPRTSASLSAGLPLVEGKATPGLCQQAAQKAGFSARLLENLPLNEIHPLTLPCQLFLHHAKACVLVGVSEDQKQVEVLFPGLPLKPGQIVESTG